MLGYKPLPQQAVRDGDALLLEPTGSQDSPVAVCCICGFFRDQSELSNEEVLWVTPCRYGQKHGVNLSDCAVTHTYCPGCFEKVQERVGTYEELIHLC